MFRPFFILLTFLVTTAQAQVMIRGMITERDSNVVMPFVYVISKASGNGTMSDNDGKFTLFIGKEDTLVCSFVGYAKSIIPVRDLKPGHDGLVRIVMNKLYVNLNMVTVTTFKIKPYEREYMKSIIDDSQIRKLDYATSPISALYMTYSREGKQLRKLARIFEDILYEEEVQKKLSAETLRRLTGDDAIDYEAFRKYCVYLTREYIATHEGVELYSKVMDCYKRFKAEKTSR